MDPKSSRLVVTRRVTSASAPERFFGVFAGGPVPDGELPPARCLRAPCAGRAGSLAILLLRSRLIASGFVNAKITSSLALAGGVEQQTYSIFKKAALQSREGWGNRLPVSVSLPAETISAGTVKCETLGSPQKPDYCTGSL